MERSEGVARFENKLDHVHNNYYNCEVGEAEDGRFSHDDLLGYLVRSAANCSPRRAD